MTVTNSLHRVVLLAALTRGSALRLETCRSRVDSVADYLRQNYFQVGEGAYFKSI